MPTIIPYNTILIFDWDDTILPISWLSSKGMKPGQPFDITEDIATQLEILDKMCIEVLNKTLLLGKVVIITNSMNGWVETSSRIFLPQVHKFLAKIEVISAPEIFPHLSIKNCKAEVFRQLIKKNILNVLSFGDSFNDRDSLFVATKDNPSIYSKSFKFLRTPNINDFKNQIQILINKLEELCKMGTNLDMVLIVKND